MTPTGVAGTAGDDRDGLPAAKAGMGAATAPHENAAGHRTPGIIATVAWPIAASLGRLLITAVVVLAGWAIFLRVANVSVLVGKGPVDVWRFLVSGPGAAANRSSLAGPLGVTLHDAGTGYALGLVAGTLIAVIFRVARPIERAFLPVALIVRTVPIVAMTPVIVLVFGRGIAGVAVIGGLVVFFPTLINVTRGLRSVPADTLDLLRAYGAGQWDVVRKVALPSALPYFFAAARIGIPGSLVGGMLAEWLATGSGLGYRMLSDTTTFQYTDLWSSVVVLTGTSVVAYYVVNMLESALLARFGSAAARS